MICTPEFQLLFAKWRHRIDIGDKEFDNLSPKQQRELACLLRVAEYYDHFPDGIIKSGDSPDFCVHSKDHIIGIEMTELMDRDIREDDARWARIIKKAEGYFNKSMEIAIPLVVEIMPRSLNFPNGRVDDEIAKGIAENVKNNMPGIDKKTKPFSCNIPLT